MTLWHTIRFDCEKHDIQTLEDICFTLGAISIQLEDAGDEPLFEPLPNQTPLWQAIKATALFDADAPLDSIVLALEKAGALCQVVPLPDKDWTKEWMRHYQPILVNGLWIVPKWLDTPATPCVYIDPGLAFGTGYHATTRLCIDWLVDTPLQGARVLDFGCGSGILAVVAKTLGAGEAVGVDIDPQALLASTQNAKHNGVQIDTYLPADFLAQKHAPFDIICANILAKPLISLAPLFAMLLKPTGKIVLSGLTHTQVDEVKEAYAKVGFKLQAHHFTDQSDAHWRRLSGEFA